MHKDCLDLAQYILLNYFDFSTLEITVLHLVDVLEKEVRVDLAHASLSQGGSAICFILIELFLIHLCHDSPVKN